jgi:hypothetical protein
VIVVCIRCIFADSTPCIKKLCMNESLKITNNFSETVLSTISSHLKLFSRIDLPIGLREHACMLKSIQFSKEL